MRHRNFNHLSLYLETMLKMQEGSMEKFSSALGSLGRPNSFPRAKGNFLCLLQDIRNAN